MTKKYEHVESRLELQRQMDQLGSLPIFDNTLSIKVKKLHPNAVIPKYAKPGDAGMDLIAVSKQSFLGKITYGFGLAFEIPKGHFMMIVPRSSISKKDLYLTNHCGIIDSGFRGEIKAIFREDSLMSQNLDDQWSIDIVNDYNIGDKVAQAIILPYPQIQFEEVQELSETERGEGGFGSSGD